ncbi:MAG: DUF4147 domain-containing protein [Thermoprotei archaeon]
MFNNVTRRKPRRRNRSFGRQKLIKQPFAGLGEWFTSLIRNSRDLAGNRKGTNFEAVRRALISCLEKGVWAATPGQLFLKKTNVSGAWLGTASLSEDLSKFEHVYVLGAGKAALGMAEFLNARLGTRISGGVVAAAVGGPGRIGRIRVLPASHPLPTELSVRAGSSVLELAEKRTERDLYVVLLSGGASAMLCSPIRGVSLDDKREATRLLLNSGASIWELNCVRKHISKIKGGRLQELIYPARSITVVISDVSGYDISTVGSGPTLPDDTTFSDALTVLEDRKLTARAPGSVVKALENGSKGYLRETPKPGDPCFSSARTLNLGSSTDACEAIVGELKEKGYNPILRENFLSGDVRKCAEKFVSELLPSAFAAGYDSVVVSGETTVEVRGPGRGGRNQEFCLFLAPLIKNTALTVCSLGTDGIDGSSEAAGAFVDGLTYSRAEKSGLSIEQYLSKNDSGSFFEKMGDAILTGPTGTNVSDVAVAVTCE